MATTATGTATRSQPRRADLGRRSLFVILVASLLMAALAGARALLTGTTPGNPTAQSAAIAGAILLLTPVGFSLAKRSGWSASPPAWFVAHVICSAFGTILIGYHVGGGDLLSPPGLVFLALVFLVIQGTLARALLSERIATLFASRVSSFHYADADRRERIRRLVERKRALLPRLDPQADEALFSPNLWHGLRHPWRTLRYARLAAAEARLAGRREAGVLLALWRRAHIAVACLFVAGLIAHVVVVTLFAGYAAGGGTVPWWHIADWGG